MALFQNPVHTCFLYHTFYFQSCFLFSNTIKTFYNVKIWKIHYLRSLQVCLVLLPWFSWLPFHNACFFTRFNFWLWAHVYWKLTVGFFETWFEGILFRKRFLFSSPPVPPEVSWDHLKINFWLEVFQITQVIWMNVIIN